MEEMKIEDAFCIDDEYEVSNKNHRSSMIPNKEPATTVSSPTCPDTKLAI